MNLEGKFIDKFTATIEGDNSSVINHASRTRMPDVYHKRKLYFLVIPNKDFSNSAMFDESTKLELEFDVNTRKSSFKNVLYPTTYRDQIWGMSHAIPCRVMNAKGQFIYSFGIDPLLYVTDFNTTQSYNAKSDYIDEIKPFDKKGGLDANKNYFIETPYYGEILYDSYRNVYYRFARREIPITDSQGNINIWENKPCSIIILDEQFQKIGETLLEPNKSYYPRDSFIGKKGLYISNNHPQNPALDENKLKFTIFKLTKNEK